MKAILHVTRWVLGVTMCLISIAGFAMGDIGIAIFTTLIGLLLLPPVTNFFAKKQSDKQLAIAGASSTVMAPVEKPATVAAQAIVIPHPIQNNPVVHQSVQQSPKSIEAVAEPVIKKKSGGFFAWFKKKGTSLKAGLLLDYCLERISSIDASTMNSVMKSKESWTEKDNETFSQRIIRKYDKYITSDNVESAGQKYLDFYKTIFPDRSGDEIVAKINVHKVEAFLFTKVNDDEALDPTEIQQIITYSKSLNVPDFDTKEKISKDYDYYITNWELDNGLFKGLASDFMMNKNEICIFKLDNCEFVEKKSVTVRRSYGGMSYRVRIAKGVSYNMGSYRTSSDKETIEVSKGKGTLNITTKRILFKGKEGVTTINSNAIVDLEPFKDAVVIHKTTGKPITLKTNDGIKLYKYIRTAARGK